MIEAGAHTSLLEPLRGHPPNANRQGAMTERTFSNGVTFASASTSPFKRSDAVEAERRLKFRTITPPRRPIPRFGTLFGVVLEAMFRRDDYSNHSDSTVLARLLTVGNTAGSLSRRDEPWNLTMGEHILADVSFGSTGMDFEKQVLDVIC